ncbi:AAA family ATPase [Flavipsychrobacter stenotrophus]|uniref:AAA family ATPase n=1 Tax=Flavipsychrobacter stenotrophus TaxID=2077091 RepID=A0A2S7SQQ2_9BACT|nr:MoxR family ATPase [Flavipsychrobacter stenotrophus]PQJ09233.1 AAA family ATPase [Flavipsychrobacter stenotrophus]
MQSYANDIEAANALKESVAGLRKAIGTVIVGQDDVVEKLIISILCNGHSLLVGVPGLAKTLLVKTIADALHLSFKRIQFTPDLMPSDITGAEILNEQRQFQFIKGPLFANIVLADEINRTPPKTQAALLEAMQERNITAAGVLYKLPAPFFVLATQNPIEQEGTYPLPEAQLDRFMFQITLDYPSFAEEVRIVKSTTGAVTMEIEKVLSAEDILAFQDLVRRVPVPDNVLEYAVGLVQKTRPNTSGASPIANQFIAYGAGPRASQYLILGAKCHALLRGKYSPDIEDVKAMALPVLRHRILRNYKAEAEGMLQENLIKQLL